jgi:predicted AlkP superfamily pyrophosphatase or phosphodiesterase
MIQLMLRNTVRVLIALVVLAALAASACSFTERAQPAPTPKLVVLVVVDQMRADYIDRFRSQFSGGLGWLVENGVLFSDAHHDHANTSTAPGHATIATGAFPSHHGIVGNDYYDRKARRVTYSFADSTSAILGYPDASGRSPVNLLREGLADWLKAQSPSSKVFSVAIKDRAAIALAGKSPDGAYWFNFSAGDFVTASYYGTEYPDWVEDFNESDRSERYCGVEWTRLLPEASYAQSREDDFPAEKTLIGRTFPHLLTGTDGQPDSRYFNRLPETPFGDELTLEFAVEMMRNEGLGLDETVDLLLVGLSSADYIGHAFGPYSQEVQDYYLRLDRMLAEFFGQIEEVAGTDGYLVVLTGDHGVLPMPEELSRRGIDAARSPWRGLVGPLRQVITASVDSGLIPDAPRLRNIAGFVLDFGQSPPPPDREARLRQLLVAKLREHRHMGAAYEYDEVAAGSGSGEIFDKFARTIHPDRGADILFAPRKWYRFTGESTGTTHGSPYEYDTHIPLIFAGGSLKAERRDGAVRSVDITPTLASLMQVAAPTDVDGRDLRPQR